MEVFLWHKHEFGSCGVLVTCESSCGHMFCNQSRWELTAHKRDQLKSSSAFIPFSSLSRSSSLSLTCFLTVSSCLLTARSHHNVIDSRNQKTVRNALFFFPRLCLLSLATEEIPCVSFRSASQNREEVEAQSGTAWA